MKELFRYILFLLLSVGTLSELIGLPSETLFIEHLEQDADPDCGDEGKGFGKDKVVVLRKKVNYEHYIYFSNSYCIADRTVEGEDYSECAYLPPESFIFS
ncbi:MAG: hypothetical protein K1X55_14185 [Chitinophagales bacterium]|nr:hypothetical protein [Chitinophagales bacterium]